MYAACVSPFSRLSRVHRRPNLTSLALIEYPQANRRQAPCHVTSRRNQLTRSRPHYPPSSHSKLQYTYIDKLSIRLRPNLGNNSKMAPLLPTSSASSSRTTPRQGSLYEYDQYSNRGGVEAYSLPRGERGVPLVLRRLLKYGSMVRVSIL